MFISWKSKRVIIYRRVHKKLLYSYTYFKYGLSKYRVRLVSYYITYILHINAYSREAQKFQKNYRKNILKRRGDSGK